MPPEVNPTVTLWNQGRVVGLSAYEIYVRHHIAQNPDVPPAPEGEWLASSISSGASMLLYLPVSTTESFEEDTYNYVDFQLPSDSRLCAANTIVASYFDGEGYVPEGSNFAIRVKDYGTLIDNSAIPVGTATPTTNIPTKSELFNNADTRDKLLSYSRVVDGIVIQPGEWTNADVGSQPPAKAFSPDLSQYPRLRLCIYGKLLSDIYILFTGFTLRAVISGTSGTDSTNPNHPEDGDFLGPAIFPWANKIIFTASTALIHYITTNKYIRQIPSGSTNISVTDNPIIDMKYSDPGTYYESYSQNARKQYNVVDFTQIGDGTPVLTVYQLDDELPPALYGTYVKADGTNYLNPLDTVAPGTVKIFTDADKAALYEKKTVENYSLVRNSDFTLNQIQIGSGGRVTQIPVADIQPAVVQDASGATLSTEAQITVGNKKQTIIALSNQAGTQQTISNPPKTTLDTEDVYWAALLQALKQDKKINVLGEVLKQLKDALTSASPGSSGQDYNIHIDANGDISIKQYTPDMTNFFTRNIYCEGNNTGPGAKDIYDSMYITMFGYDITEGSSGNTFTYNQGSFTVNVNDGNVSDGSGAHNWFQRFTITGSNATYLKQVIQRLSEFRTGPDGILPFDTIVINIMPTASYNHNGTPMGASISGDVVGLAGWSTCFIDVSNWESLSSFKGIIYSLNNGHIGIVQSSTRSCYLALANIGTINYDPTGWSW